MVQPYLNIKITYAEYFFCNRQLEKRAKVLYILNHIVSRDIIFNFSLWYRRARRSAMMWSFWRVISKSNNVTSSTVTKHIINLVRAEIEIRILVTFWDSINLFRLHQQKCSVSRVPVWSPLAYLEFYTCIKFFKPIKIVPNWSKFFNNYDNIW